MAQFTLKGQKINLSKGDLEKTADKMPYCEIRKYGVRVDGKILPPKRLLNEVLKTKGINMGLSSFTTMDAIFILRKLGFEVEEIRGGSLLNLAGIVSIGGDAVKDKRNLYGKNFT